MPKRREVSIPLTGLLLTDAADGSTTDLGEMAGVHLMMLMRHRH